jgi:hypothetical protein
LRRRSALALSSKVLETSLCDTKGVIELSFMSNANHRKPYVSSPAEKRRLADIKILLNAIRTLSIEEPVKKRILVHVVWEIAFATGNTQVSFMGRYRSAKVVSQSGLPIQRDHINKKAALIAALLGPSPDLEAIIERAQCCVVTDDEHAQLGAVGTKIDGWERYLAAGISVYDMATDSKVV